SRDVPDRQRYSHRNRHPGMVAEPYGKPAQPAARGQIPDPFAGGKEIPVISDFFLLPSVFHLCISPAFFFSEAPRSSPVLPWKLCGTGKPPVLPPPVRR